MDLLDFIASDNYIPYNRTLAKQIGVENAIIFGALCGYQRHYKQEEFYREQQNIMEDTCLSEYSVRKSIKELQALGLIVVTKKGLPAKYYYRISSENLMKLLSTSGVKNDTTGDNENITTINNNRYIKESNNNKNKNKNKIINSFEFTDKSKKAIEDWLQYKKEKKQTYKEKGLEILCKKLFQMQKDNGENYLINAINHSMANNYAGIYPDNKAKDTNKEDIRKAFMIGDIL